jgi:diacylglycerol kinase family enzyme
VAGTTLLYNGFAGKLKTNKFYELLDCKEVKIKAAENSLWQKDGEPMIYNQPEVQFKINPKSLWMWV